jgi:hypothetical protein
MVSSLLRLVRLLIRLFDKGAKKWASSNIHEEGPDPVVGVGLVIVGILIMGIGGAATAHYLFNFGSGIAILGAVLFVLFVALSTYREQAFADVHQSTPPEEKKNRPSAS